MCIYVYAYIHIYNHNQNKVLFGGLINVFLITQQEIGFANSASSNP